MDGDAGGAPRRRVCGVARGEDWRRLMTEGKLGADLGNHDQASTAFRAVANDVSTPRSLRWEALVRLGLVRSAAGDPEASAEAFRTVLANYPTIRRRCTSSPAPSPVAYRARSGSASREVRGASSDCSRRLEREVRSGDDAQEGHVQRRRRRAERHLGHAYDANSGDSYILEVAAYEVDKMLGLDMVPPTVPQGPRGRGRLTSTLGLGCETSTVRR